MIRITLPDGSQREYDQPLTVFEVAASIGTGLAKAAVAGRVDGMLVDCGTLIEQDAAVSIITPRDTEGLEILRHSCAHLLAMAVKQLYPSAQVTIGPVIEDGFFYDFACERAFTPKDLELIEARMQTLAATNIRYTAASCHATKPSPVLKRAASTTRPRSSAPSRTVKAVTVYRQGDFEDLCRGPHVPSTGCCKPSS